jgi:methionyl-tRNA formyltransferase
VKVWRAQEATRKGDARRSAIGVVDADAMLETARGGLVLEEVQPEGKRAMAGTAWRAGLRGDGRVDLP